MGRAIVQEITALVNVFEIRHEVVMLYAVPFVQVLFARVFLFLLTRIFFSPRVFFFHPAYFFSTSAYFFSHPI
jgi:hypothetical protein